jgi:hypothetical protein
LRLRRPRMQGKSLPHLGRIGIARGSNDHRKRNFEVSGDPTIKTIAEANEEAVRIGGIIEKFIDEIHHLGAGRPQIVFVRLHCDGGGFRALASGDSRTVIAMLANAIFREAAVEFPPATVPSYTLRD